MLEEKQDRPLLQVTLPKEYEDALVARFTALAREGFTAAMSDLGLSNKKFLNEKELRVYLGVGQGTLDDLIERGLLTFSKVGRQKLYKLEDVENAIEALKF